MEPRLYKYCKYCNNWIFYFRFYGLKFVNGIERGCCRNERSLLTIARQKTNIAMIDEENKYSEVETASEESTSNLSWLHKAAPGYPANGSKVCLFSLCRDDDRNRCNKSGPFLSDNHHSRSERFLFNIDQQMQDCSTQDHPRLTLPRNWKAGSWPSQSIRCLLSQKLHRNVPLTLFP